MNLPMIHAWAIARTGARTASRITTRANGGAS